jgi:hypothetical protein
VKPLVSDKIQSDFESRSQNIEFLSQQAMQDVRKNRKNKKTAQALGETIEG